MDELDRVVWRKSSRSGGNGGNCVEVGFAPGAIGVRDSKDRDGGRLTLAPAQWRAFLVALADDRIG
ncbi:DUF397 domain-containing protein [Saccharopolyspora shandongensis]|uniref:DUF397 domain-containing protein n=1 Tax=Saccharopolyspora shandongensis TaxID=418495 RepID=UPI0034062E6A